MVKVSEHEKLKKIVKESQACGTFVEWLAERGFYIVSRKRSVRFNLQRELEAFFEIDGEKLENEKRAMLDDLRKGNS